MVPVSLHYAVMIIVSVNTALYVHTLHIIMILAHNITVNHTAQGRCNHYPIVVINGTNEFADSV